MDAVIWPSYWNLHWTVQEANALPGGINTTISPKSDFEGLYLEKNTL